MKAQRRVPSIEHLTIIMVKTFKLNLDGHHCYPGSTVRGFVLVAVDKAKDYKQITVRLSGRAQVQWQVRSGSGNTETVILYHNCVSYIDGKYILWSRDGILSGQFPIGEHTYPFEFLLPENIPSSLETSTGQIRYEVEAEISQSRRLKLNHKISTVLTVKGKETIPSICMTPKSVDMTNHTKWCCFDFGPVSVTCHLPQTGFSPGDSITLNMYVENESTKNIRVRTSLYREYVFFSSGGDKQVEGKHVSSLLSDQIHAGVLTSLQDICLKIPVDAPMTLRNCSCISVEYCIFIKTVTPFGSSTEKRVPLLIANSYNHFNTS